MINPKDYNIPAGFKHWEGDGAEDHMGPFFFKLTDQGIQTALRVGEQHVNAHKTIHGGILMALADYTLCLGAIGGTHDSLVTVTCNNEFVGPADIGELVIGYGEVIRKGGSLAFMRCVLKVEERTVLSSSGVIKLLRNKSQ